MFLQSSFACDESDDLTFVGDPVWAIIIKWGNFVDGLCIISGGTHDLLYFDRDGRMANGYSMIQKKLSFWRNKKLSCWNWTKVSLYTTKLCKDSIWNNMWGMSQCANSHASCDASSASYHHDIIGHCCLQCQQVLVQPVAFFFRGKLSNLPVYLHELHFCVSDSGKVFQLIGVWAQYIQ